MPTINCHNPSGVACCAQYCSKPSGSCSTELQLTPLNAAFVSALYLAGTLGLILTLFDATAPMRARF